MHRYYCAHGALLFTLGNSCLLGQGEGVNQKQAADCASVMYRKIEDANLNALIQESMTPYGLNEMAMKTINANGGFNPWKLALAAVKQKIESD